jgi:hypothetical protein
VPHSEWSPRLQKSELVRPSTSTWVKPRRQCEQRYCPPVIDNGSPQAGQLCELNIDPDLLKVSIVRWAPMALVPGEHYPAGWLAFGCFESFELDK